MPRLPSWRRCVAVVLLSALVGGLVLLDASLAQTDKGKKYALLVGVRTYRHSDLENLKYTENDVEELAKVLKGFTEVVVLTTSAGERKAELAPTAKNIRAQLKRLLEKVTRHDIVLVGLAGHGLQLKVTDRSEEEGFFCPSDARPRRDVTFVEQSKTLIGFSELFKELQESGVGVKLLLVDACRNNPAAGRSVNADTIPRVPNGLAALFSCSSGERAFETDRLGKGHGVFFHYVIQGLKGSAKNNRGEVTWDRLAEYVKEQVSDEVPKLIKNGAKQTPEERKTLKGKAPVLIDPLGVKVVKEGTAVEAPAGSGEAGWTQLFNGKNLLGWKTHPTQPGNWRVGKGVLISSDRVSHLYTNRGDYTDFHLRLEVRINDRGNSGVHLRAPFGPNMLANGKMPPSPKNRPTWIAAYNTKMDLRRFGGLLIGASDELHRVREVPRPRDWFTYEVTITGNHIVIKVNGETTTDWTDDRECYTKGHIVLQQHSSAGAGAEFRKIEVKELKNVK